MIHFSLISFTFFLFFFLIYQFLRNFSFDFPFFIIINQLFLFIWSLSLFIRSSHPDEKERFTIVKFEKHNKSPVLVSSIRVQMGDCFRFGFVNCCYYCRTSYQVVSLLLNLCTDIFHVFVPSLIHSYILVFIWSLSLFIQSFFHHIRIERKDIQ